MSCIKYCYCFAPSKGTLPPNVYQFISEVALTYTYRDVSIYNLSFIRVIYFKTPCC
ncbi:hypothetical protein BANRA_04345 [Escherichia coli]|nr:hypothetical protein BANRA_04345 [Escherichia coli]